MINGNPIFLANRQSVISPIVDNKIDDILALQITIAWAGEGLSEPKRLGWWQTDLVDEAGGGDFFARLLPKTHQWASLEAVRKAALQADTHARLRMAKPDEVRTLFFWGFKLDEKLQERIIRHKQENKNPIDTLPFPINLYEPFDKFNLAEALRIPDQESKYKITPGGRELIGHLPESSDLKAKHLAAALLPFSDQYPMPFFRIKNQAE